MKFYKSLTNLILIIVISVACGLLVFATTESIVYGILTLLFIYNIPLIVYMVAYRRNRKKGQKDES